MSQHPLNLAFRFLLELAILAALVLWGWTQFQGVWRILVAVGAPFVAALLWGTLRVPGDGGEPRVAVPGSLRLLLEAALFLSAYLALRASDRPVLALVFAAATLLHYALSYDRIRRLLR